MTEVEATISAAHIQGIYAIVAAILGLIIVIVSILLGYDGYKKDKLAEAKRDVYLELVQSWQGFLITVHGYKIEKDIEAYFKKFQESLFEVLGALHKASFISDPFTKEKVLDFTMEFSKTNFGIRPLVEQWYKAAEESDERQIVVIELMDLLNPVALQAMNLQIILRDELGLKENKLVNDRILEKQKDFAKDIKEKLRTLRGS